MKFKWIIALSALFIAGCAAYFSVTGISMLFSGSLLGVAIMASSLEIGKLVAASYLHRNWNKMSKFFKVYLTTAVVVLMFVTSMGIFGFLSNAYQKTALKVDQIQGQVELLQNRKEGFAQDISRYNKRIETLSSQRTSQETRYDSLVAGDDWVNARRTYNLIESSDKQIEKLNYNITANRDSINKIQTEILKIKNDNQDLSKEIGGFKFVAESFNIPIQTAVKYFILVLIFVFDPLAVSLVLAFNSYIEENMNDDGNDSINNSGKPIEKALNINEKTSDANKYSDEDPLSKVSHKAQKEAKDNKK